MEGDHIRPYTLHTYIYFNPLPPHGGRLTPEHAAEVMELISIHSLRMEGDPQNNISIAFQFNFNPLPPHGGRL